MQTAAAFANSYHNKRKKEPRSPLGLRRLESQEQSKGSKTRREKTFTLQKRRRGSPSSANAEGREPQTGQTRTCWICKWKKGTTSWSGAGSSGGATAEEGPGQELALSSPGLKVGPGTQSRGDPLNISHCTWLYSTSHSSNPLPETPILIPHFSSPKSHSRRLNLCNRRSILGG